MIFLNLAIGDPFYFVTWKSSQVGDITILGFILFRYQKELFTANSEINWGWFNLLLDSEAQLNGGRAE